MTFSAVQIKAFQSTPPVAGRRCKTQSVARIRFDVSIHAPRCREAMPKPMMMLITASMFQSTPPVAGRRCSTNLNSIIIPPCFNPRPPLPGGDAISILYRSGDRNVSIHAPRCREAMQATP